MKEKSIIKQMFYGNKGLHDQIKLTKEAEKLTKKVIENDYAIKEKLKEFPELLSLYEKTNDSLEAMYGEYLGIHFVEGVKFGIALGFEAAEEI